MNWLNLETKILHSPEFIGCKPVSRATWLSVSMWCATQENGGRVAGGKLWGSRQWQQMCGVTRAEIDAAMPLLMWDGDDLIVWNYPAEKEMEVQSEREGGRRGGSSKTQAKTEASRQNGSKGGRPKTQAITQAMSEENPSHNPTEGNGKEEEGNGKERNRAASPPISFSNTVMPNLETWLARATPADDWESDWWTKVWQREAKAQWRMRGGREIKDWCIHQDSFLGYFRSAKAEHEAKNAPPDVAAFEAERAAEIARRSEVEAAEIAELQAGLKRGRQ